MWHENITGSVPHIVMSFSFLVQQIANALSDLIFCRPAIQKGAVPTTEFLVASTPATSARLRPPIILALGFICPPISCQSVKFVSCLFLSVFDVSRSHFYASCVFSPSALVGVCNHSVPPLRNRPRSRPRPRFYLLPFNSWQSVKFVSSFFRAASSIKKAAHFCAAFVIQKFLLFLREQILQIRLR